MVPGIVQPVTPESGILSLAKKKPQIHQKLTKKIAESWLWLAGVGFKTLNLI